MSEILIRTEHLCKSYNDVMAVNDVSITIEKGSIVGLVGKNGAGKTTLIRLLTGLSQPSSGTFEVIPERKRTNTMVAAIVERPSIYTDMTAMDNLRAQCMLLGLTVDDGYLKQTLNIVGLSPELCQNAKNFSLGMQQRLAIAMTLVGKPELLILDEPTNGLDPQGIHDMRELFVKLNRDLGTTVIISSHILSELGKFATEYFFMDHGKVIKHATASELDAIGSKRLRVTVDDVKKAKEVLSALGEVVITSEDIVELLGEHAPTEILLTLAQNGIVANNIVNVGDNLEEFFINLVGGEQ